jgi:GMP synthase (glutamine-hydrolysing) A subunit
LDRDTVAILDFGSQYTQLIARRLRELQVYSEILPPRTKPAALRSRGIMGIVLSGGPDSVFDKGSPRCDRGIFDLGVPVLGICYGMQLMSHLLEGQVKRSGRREYGQAAFQPRGGRLLRGMAQGARVWMSHGDDIQRAPAGFSVVGRTGTNAIAAIENLGRRQFGILFHPEVAHIEEGRRSFIQRIREMLVPGKYFAPTIMDIPQSTQVYIDSLEPRWYYGVKSFSETTIGAVPGAISNAIFNACGVRIREHPITREKIMAGLASKRASQASGRQA